MINIDQMIERARVAQKEFEENFTTQEKVDAIVKDIGKVVYDHAEPLARLAIDETRMGVYEDKVAKNKGKSRTVLVLLILMKSLVLLQLQNLWVL